VSASAKQPSSWFAQNAELIALAAVLLLLLGSAVFLLVRIGAAGRQLRDGVPEAPVSQRKAVEPIDGSEFRERIERIGGEFEMPQYENRMFVSELRVSAVGSGKPIPYHALTDPFTGLEQPPVRAAADRDTDADGLPDEFELEHGLNPYDPDDAGFDLDGDGFTNREEYLAGTAIDDPEDFPDLTAKLRIREVRAVPFKLRFNAMMELPGGRLSFQLNMRNLSQTYFVQVGEVINDEKHDIVGYKVVEFVPGVRGDPSKRDTLILEKGDKRIRLERDKLVSENERVALLVFLLDGSEYPVRIGDALTLREQTYNVVDIKPDRVLLTDAQTGREYRIEMMSEQDEEDLARPPRRGEFPALEGDLSDGGMMVDPALWDGGMQQDPAARLRGGTRRPAPVDLFGE
jgi:hypothetical protein